MYMCVSMNWIVVHAYEGGLELLSYLDPMQITLLAKIYDVDSKHKKANLSKDCQCKK